MPTLTAESHPRHLVTAERTAVRPRVTHDTDSRPGAHRRQRHLPRTVSFWLVAAITAAILAASSAPSPLYPVYQADFGFSASVLTTIFAVYVVALLASLLVVGRLSDHVGRRPVLASALVVEAGAMAAFLAADGVGWLITARIVQGLATGAAIGVLGAYLLDLQPMDGSRLGSLINSVAPTSGLAIGAIGTGVLVQYAPDPTRLVFVVLLPVFAVLALLVTVLPETVLPIGGALAALRPQVAVPSRARRAFAAAAPTMIATWALGGLVLSVGGSLAAEVFGITDFAVVGLIIGVFAGSGAVAGVLVRDLDPDRASLVGTTALVLGVGLFVLSVATTSLPVFVIASVVAGSGFGSGFLGSLRAVSRLAEPHERAALLSAIYTVSYTAFSIPAYVAGLITTHVGLRDTTLGYGGFVALIALVALVAQAATVRTAEA